MKYRRLFIKLLVVVSFSACMRKNNDTMIHLVKEWEKKEQ